MIDEIIEKQLKMAENYDKLAGISVTERSKKSNEKARDTCLETVKYLREYKELKHEKS